MDYYRDTYSPPSHSQSTTTPNSSSPDFAANISSVFQSRASLATTQQRLNQARLVLEYQQLCDHYDICLSRLQDYTREMETLRRENADLRSANAALFKLFNSLNYLNKEVSGGFSPKSVMEPSSSALHRRIEKRAEEKEEERKAAVEMELYNQGSWKTELCNKWEETAACPYGGNCQFAHGITELQPVIRHPKYKTQICRMVLYGGTCPYGHRCHFRHSLTQQERSLRRCSHATLR